MAASHGSKATLKLDNSVGTLVDLSGYITSVAMPRTIDTAETSALADTAKEYVIGLEDGQITLEGNWDPTLDAHMNGVKRGLTGEASISYEYGPAGSAGGAVKYSGECFLTAYDQTSPIGDASRWTATLQLTGAVTRGTW